MGGTYGEIRGRSKIGVYLKYQEETDRLGHTFLSKHPDPKYKKFCKSSMDWDPELGEWVLYYHLHT
jgi:hypothetical protein